MIWSQWLRRRPMVAVLVAAWMIAGLHAQALAQEADGPTMSPPISYRFNDPNPRVENSVYSVYQTSDVSVVVRHPRGQAPDFEHPAWYAGDRSHGRIAQILQTHRPVLVETGAGGFEWGVRRRRRCGKAAFVSYDHLQTHLVRGQDDRQIAGQSTHQYILTVSFDRTRFDGDGRQLGSSTQAYRHRLWVAEHLPYSPAFAHPFRLLGRLFVDEPGTKLGEAVFDDVRPALRKKGLVLRMEFWSKDAKKPAYVLQADAVSHGPKRAAKLPPFPVITEQTYAKIAPVTIISGMLQPADLSQAAQSSFDLNYSGDASGSIHGSAVWGTNQRGDFALLLSLPAKFGRGRATDQQASDEEIFLLLMRSMHGRPGAGEYDIASVAGDFESLPTDKLKSLSKKFTVMGVIRRQGDDQKHPDVYTLIKPTSGQVTIADDPDKGRLDGEFHLTVDGVALTDAASNSTIEIKAEFDARQALDNVGSSTITQALNH